MKLTFLGTAASEGLPAVFCNCEYCKEAKRLGGKNIRTRSQTLINGELLIDFPADTYTHFLNNNIDGDTIKYLLVTHSHGDHFYPADLDMRKVPYAHDMRVERLKLYFNEGAAKKYDTLPGKARNKIDCQMLKPFDKVEFGDYKVTALPARHYPGDNALFYIIQQGGKTLLYAHDTGYFYDEVFEFIEKEGFVFDIATLDCTNVDIPITDEGTHMGIDNINRVLEKLRNIGAVTENTTLIVNHFSHNARPLHEVLEKRVAEYGYIVTYDGMSIEI